MERFFEFDILKTAQTVNLSTRHFQRLFKESTGITPFEYYKNIKIEKLKEKVLDTSLSIEQAFMACGVDYRGTILSFLKTPSECRRPKTEGRSWGF